MSSTTVSATITDSAGQVWANGSYRITFVPNPNLPSANYQWNGENFVPQVLQGVMDGSGRFSVSLPDNSTITPAGTAWLFVLSPNATATSTGITVPVSGASIDFSALFSARVIPPTIFAAPMPRAYSSNEVAEPPPLTGGEFFNVTTNVPEFWNGTQWVVLGGTVGSVGLSMPGIFAVSGSPVTSNGTINVVLNPEGAFTVFANQTSGSAQPAFGTLTAATIAQAGTLTNNTTGNSSTSTTATNVAGGYVVKVVAGTAIGVSPGGGQGSVTVSNTGVTSIVAGTGITVSGATGAVTVNAPPPTFTGSAGHQTLPSGLILQWGNIGAFNTGPVTVTFPVTFPNSCLNVTASDLFGTQSVIVSIVSISAASFVIRNDDPGGGAYWFAIGF
jgi:hypothetical protein